jgi:hypothetical protein
MYFEVLRSRSITTGDEYDVFRSIVCLMCSQFSEPFCSLSGAQIDVEQPGAFHDSVLISG